MIKNAFQTMGAKIDFFINSSGTTFLELETQSLSLDEAPALMWLV